MRPPRLIPSLLLSLAACGGQEQPATPPAARPAPDLPGVEFDFGAIPHGEKRSHTFEIRIPGGGKGYAPVGFSSGCSCGSAQFMVRQVDGTIRNLAGLPFSEHALQEGEELQLEVIIDSSLKEPADVAPVTMRGLASVQDVPSQQPRLTMPVVFHYSIDAPVAVLPRAHVDFGQLPHSGAYSQLLELRPDGGAEVAFGPVETSDPRLQAHLRTDDGVTLIDLRFEPAEHDSAGPVRASIRVQTDLPGDYALNVPVSGEIIPDIVVQPYARLGFGHFDFATPAETFVTIHDHDSKRDPEFVVRSITDPNGRSLAEHFECRLEALPGRPRSTRVVLRYLGTMEAKSFRGVLTLAKPDGGPNTDIEFVGFHRQP